MYFLQETLGNLSVLKDEKVNREAEESIGELKEVFGNSNELEVYASLPLLPSMVHFRNFPPSFFFFCFPAKLKKKEIEKHLPIGSYNIIADL